ncbi:lanthionine synthetase C family protein [Actinoplanes sp. NPDC051859]|uniref:lanthionine synthetase C family protein n=1 Tax=Actinoplanes sp. NPDC051859 TaxID=3363909 RepID=UPI0037A65C42
MTAPTRPAGAAVHHRAAVAAAAELADTLAAPPPVIDLGGDDPGSRRWRDQSLSKGAAGVAILHAERAHNGDGPQARVHAWLAQATREDLSAGPKAGLWFGAPAVTFSLHTTAAQQHPQALAQLDEAVTRLVHRRLVAADTRLAACLRPPVAEYDLVRGLTGLGAYLLHRHPHGTLIRRVLAYLVRLSEPLLIDDEAGPQAPGWWSPDGPYGGPDPRWPGGHGNFGMAHGIAGPLALLSLAIRHGITVDGHAAALTRICEWLDQWRVDSPTGSWWPPHIDVSDLHTGPRPAAGPGRPSWCYGTPGLARALQLAGIALGDRDRQHAAEQALAACLADPAQLAQIVDPAICHGWAGLALTAWHVHADALCPAVGTHLPALLERLVTHARDPLPDDLPGLVDGRAGIALTLHHLTAGTTGDWTSCLLLD